MSAGVIGVNKHRHAPSHDSRDHAGGDSMGLVLIGNYFHIHSPALGCDDCFSNFAMGKTESLHQQLVLRTVNSVYDKLPDIVSWRKATCTVPVAGRTKGPGS